jgi:hypothetical protein
MRGTGLAGIFAILFGLWWLIASWRLWRDPSRLHPDSWWYRVVYNRLRRWPWQPKEPQLSVEEIGNYARLSVTGGAIMIAGGLLLLVIHLAE